MQQKAPIAMSSAEWQEFIKNKEKEKEEKLLKSL